jgi:hypothetical protein
MTTTLLAGGWQPVTAMPAPAAVIAPPGLGVAVYRASSLVLGDRSSLSPRAAAA